jgi:hypothetical protein
MKSLVVARQHVRRAGAHLVAAVYAVSGHHVSWPLEPAPYDLLVDPGDGAALRVQVKTCTSQQAGAWVCWITRSEYVGGPAGKRRAVYPADSLDVLAVVDGDLQVYLLPFSLVAQQRTVTVRAYEAYRVGGLSLAGGPPRS